MRDILKSYAVLFLIIPLTLSIIGVIFIMSTGQTDSGFNSFYTRQIFWIITGMLAFAIVMYFDYYYYVETSIIYYTAGIIALALTLVVGREIKGATSWLGIGGFGIQVSEVVKIAYILFYAKFLRDTPKDQKETVTFAKSLLILLPPLILILLQPDIGTVLVYCGIYAAMSFVGFRNISILMSIMVVGVITTILILAYTYYQFYFVNQYGADPIWDVLLNPNTFVAVAIILLIYAVITFIIELIHPIAWINKYTQASLIGGFSFLVMGIASNMLKPYQWNRLLVFLNPEIDRLGSGYNVLQAQIAIGAGGLTGQGLFKGSQNLRGFLPEKHTDFIFAIIAEEWGFIGSFLVIALFTTYCILIARTIFSSKDSEGSYIATGVLAMFLMHIFVNIGMNLGVAPVTGLPLPFISYGGSFYLTCIICAALVLNIHSRRFIH